MSHKRLFGFDLLAQEAADHAAANVRYMEQNCKGDTPIEKLFFAALATVANMGHRAFTGVVHVASFEARDELVRIACEIGEGCSSIFVMPQVSVAGWRVDFLVQVLDYDRPDDGSMARKLRSLIVECDGHDFHERTKEQALRDRSRDREAQLQGYEVFRFTGAELWRDPIQCAEQVIDWAERTAP